MALSAPRTGRVRLARGWDGCDKTIHGKNTTDLGYSMERHWVWLDDICRIAWRTVLGMLIDTLIGA